MRSRFLATAAHVAKVLRRFGGLPANIETPNGNEPKPVKWSRIKRLGVVNHQQNGGNLCNKEIGYALDSIRGASCSVAAGFQPARCGRFDPPAASGSFGRPRHQSIERAKRGLSSLAGV